MDTVLNQELSEAGVTFPSDSLRLIYELCGKHPTLAELFEIRPQIRLVIDTNVVLDELLFVTTKRRKPSARTALREVLDSGVAVTIAPNKMHQEVDRHIPRLARERAVPEERFRQAWLELQARIEFRDVKDSAFLGKHPVDPDDIPFVLLYWTSGADAVLTRDKDISAMGAMSLRPEVLLHVRDYARAKSPEVSLRFGGVLVVGIPVVSLVGLLKLISKVLRAFRSLPQELQLLFLGGAVLAALHPRTRKAVSDGFSFLTSHLKSSAGLFGEVFGELSLEFAAAQLELKAKQTVVEGVIPKRISVPVTLAARSVIYDEGPRTIVLDPNGPHKTTKRARPKLRRTPRRVIPSKSLRKSRDEKELTAIVKVSQTEV